MLCLALILVRCPAATLNPKTKKPFCDKNIRKAFLEDCYDFDPAKPWKVHSPLQKIFLPDDVKLHRKNMSSTILHVEQYGNEPGWWLRNIVWVDPCCSVLPRSRRQYDRMRMAESKNSKRLISDDARMYNRNLRGPKESLKQASFEAERISWLMVVARGVVAVHMLPPDWRVNGEGMAAAVKELPNILRRMLAQTHLCLERFSQIVGQECTLQRGTLFLHSAVQLLKLGFAHTGAQMLRNRLQTWEISYCMRQQ